MDPSQCSKLQLGPLRVQAGVEEGGGGRGAADRAAAADILDTEGPEFRDDAGHPEPLYIAGGNSSLSADGATSFSQN